jgi:hypothetical protein
MDIPDQLEQIIHTGVLGCSLLCHADTLFFPGVCTHVPIIMCSKQVNLRSNCRAMNWSKFRWISQRKHTPPIVPVASLGQPCTWNLVLMTSSGQTKVAATTPAPKAQITSNHQEPPSKRPKWIRVAAAAAAQKLPAEAPAAAWHRRPRAVVGPWWCCCCCDDEDADVGGGGGDVATSPGISASPASTFPSPLPDPRLGCTALYC